MKLLEKSHIEQSYLDGAQFNRYLTRKSDGRIFGLDFTCTSNRIYVTKGLLVVRGYRISFDNEVLKVFDTFPEENETQNLILRITVTQDDSDANVIVGEMTYGDEIEKGVGIRDYLLASILIGPSGIQDVTSQIRDVVSVDYPSGLYCSVNSTTQDIVHELVENADDTFSSPGITSVGITIPKDIKHGFISGVNFRSDASPPSVTITNKSSFVLKIIKYGIASASYVPSARVTVTMAFFCDGMNVNCFVSEV